MKEPPKASVILVEDNPALRDELALFLSDEGYAVRGVDCGSELNLALARGHADVLVLDLNLPEEDGISIARRIRAAMPGIGIIVLTGRTLRVDRQQAYAAGVDVLLTKPTHPEELSAVLATLVARLRLPAPLPAWELKVGAMCLQPPSGAPIALTPAEVTLLREMALAGEYAEHDRLIELLGDADQPERVNKARLEVLISRLRAKLEKGAQGLQIRALRGRGYQLSHSLMLSDLPMALADKVGAT